MTQFKFLMTALSTVTIAGSVILGSTSAEACLYNKLKSGSNAFNSPDQVGFGWKDLLTSNDVAKAAGIAVATGTAGLFGLGFWSYRRREAELAAMSFEGEDQVNDEVKLHPEAPGGELEVKDNTATSDRESSQKQVVLTK
ncbi:hypothetical protein ACL6C3_16660 [Capilliphycus salinus ALCB114379]|uniref:hypothetical protein n=1 Tax=Capilliphycus salinus TaxID=2768948 RepID=UPI0039A53C39